MQRLSFRCGIVRCLRQQQLLSYIPAIVTVAIVVMNNIKCGRCLCQRVWKPTQRMLSLRFVTFLKYIFLSVALHFFFKFFWAENPSKFNQFISTSQFPALALSQSHLGVGWLSFTIFWNLLKPLGILCNLFDSFGFFWNILGSFGILAI